MSQKRTDTERLEWFVDHPNIQIRETKPVGFVVYDVLGPRVIARGAHYREAIDAAMDAEESDR